MIEIPKRAGYRAPPQPKVIASLVAVVPTALVTYVATAGLPLLGVPMSVDARQLIAALVGALVPAGAAYMWPAGARPHGLDVVVMVVLSGLAIALLFAAPRLLAPSPNITESHRLATTGQSESFASQVVVAHAPAGSRLHTTISGRLANGRDVILLEDDSSVNPDGSASVSAGPMGDVQQYLELDLKTDLLDVSSRVIASRLEMLQTAIP